MTLCVMIHVTLNTCSIVFIFSVFVPPPSPIPLPGAMVPWTLVHTGERLIRELGEGGRTDAALAIRIVALEGAAREAELNSELARLRARLVASETAWTMQMVRAVAAAADGPAPKRQRVADGSEDVEGLVEVKMEQDDSSDS